MFLFFKTAARLTADIVPFTLMQQEILRIFQDPLPSPPPHSTSPSRPILSFHKVVSQVFFKELD